MKFPRENGLNQLASSKERTWIRYSSEKLKISARFYLLQRLLQGFTIIFSFNTYVLSASHLPGSSRPSAYYLVSVETKWSRKPVFKSLAAHSRLAEFLLLLWKQIHELGLLEPARTHTCNISLSLRLPKAHWQSPCGGWFLCSDCYVQAVPGPLQWPLNPGENAKGKN